MFTLLDARQWSERALCVAHNTASRGSYDRDSAPYQRGGSRGEGRGRDEDEKKKPCHEEDEEEEEIQYEWKCVKVCEPNKNDDKDDNKKCTTKKCTTKKWNHDWDRNSY